MGHLYNGDPTLFPASATVPDDGDDIDASNEDVPVEAALDRTARLGRDLGAGGSNAFATALVPADLNAITTPANLEGRFLPGYGRYIYIAAATNYADGRFVVYGNGVTGSDPGRWLQEHYLMQGARLLNSEFVLASGANVDLSTATLNAPDPAVRAGGNRGVELLTSFGTYDLRANTDLLEVSWAVPFYCDGAVAGSDMVVGVALKDATPSYLFLDMIGDYTGSVTTPYPDGRVYGASLSGTWVVQTVLSRAGIWTPGVDRPARKIALIVANGTTLNGGHVSKQGALLAIKHWRITL